MKVGIMQPYFFPYIGYFQLINAVDKFVIYDDVNFIKGGWVNRNRILVNGQPHFINIFLNDASSYKLINEITIQPKKSMKTLKTIELNYKKAPFFNNVFPIIQTFFQKLDCKNDNLAYVAGESIRAVCRYLELDREFVYSSECYSETKGLDKADRLIAILNKNEANIYINPTGGKTLYEKSYFKDRGIDLFFINNQITPYQQFKNEFIPSLSIIDVMMFNSVEEINEMLDNFKLI
ncbi:MAG: WbqC family protein [Bacteroidales bacterium]|nr:WbqC family protein [Bacteroidales bacterium]